MKSDSYSEISRIIEFLRFPLIIGVVFIHTYSIGDGVSDDQMPIFYFISTLFSQVLGRLSVPIFFFISGYLFFFKISNFKYQIYLTKLKKRILSLLVPYIFWNILIIITFFIIIRIPFIRDLFHVTPTSIDKVLIGTYNPKYDMAYPAAYQFWFIRDLMCCVIISPLIFFFVTKTRFFGLVLLGIAWIMNLTIPYVGARGFSLTSIFFFSLGAFFSTKGSNIIDDLKSIKTIILLYPIFIIADIYTQKHTFNIYIHNVGILIGIIFVFLFVGYLLQKYKVKSIPLLTSSSFFIFAIHEPYLLSNLRKLTFLPIVKSNEIIMISLYFGLVFLTITASIMIYKLTAFLNPKLTAIITGGR